jgi:hypothetical protein
VRIVFYLSVTLLFQAPIVCLSQIQKLDSSRANELSVAALSVPSSTLVGIEKKYQRLTAIVDRRARKALLSMERNESRIESELVTSDSNKAKSLFTDVRAKYQALQERMNSSIDPSVLFPLKEYIPNVDSLQSALRYLSQSGMPIPANKLAKMQAASQALQQFQGKLQQASEIGNFIKQRQQQLKDELGKYDLGNRLLVLNKEAFYFQQQLVEYKSMVTDKRKLEQEVLTKVQDIPAFQKFMQKNSYLGQLFGLPDNYGSPQGLVGLQTRAQVQELISKVVGRPSTNGSGGDPSEYLRQKVQQAQGQLSSLKDKIRQLGNPGGTGDITMPDFKPNNQRTKTFLGRIIYGFNIQTETSTSLLPATADLGGTLGYKLRDNINFGVGLGYRLGLGQPVNHIALSSEGLNLRSYFEWKAKGNWWLTGGMEYNYMESFTRFQTILHDPEIWQASALAGITKKFKISKNKQSHVQLLFDALYKQHIPASQPLIFRMGYEF